MIRSRLGVALAAWLLTAAIASAQVAMPDARQMSGVPLPAGELANGTVTVRVVRERMGNNVPNQEVTLATPDGNVSGVTDAEGRAEFTSVTPGSKVTASTTIDGEVLRSQEFTVPTAGGVRVALVAGAAKAAEAEGAANAAAAAQPARPGAVVFGPDTRIVLEFQNDDPTFFYIFSVVNNARTPVAPASPLALTLPDAAEQASLVSGPPGLARLDDGMLHLSGPFPPGQTAFQVAFRLPLTSTIRVSQAWPAPVEGILVAAQKAGGLVMTSPQLAGIREGDNGGQMFLVGTGGRLNEGQAGELTFSNVPAPPAWPFWSAIAAAVAGLAWMAWAIVSSGPDHERERHALGVERERLLGAIAALDAETRARGADPKRDAKRERLMAAVEQIYARLDELPGGSGQAA